MKFKPWKNGKTKGGMYFPAVFPAEVEMFEVKKKPQSPQTSTAVDALQRDIWARINDEANLRGVKLSIGDAYAMGSVIKEVLHPRVAALIRDAKLQTLRDLPKAGHDCAVERRIESNIRGLLTEENPNA